MDKEYIEKLNKETDNINAYIDWANGAEEEFRLRIVNLTFELVKRKDEERQNVIDALKDLIDLTKGLDEDGKVYNAQQIDYADIKSVLKRRNIKLT